MGNDRGACGRPNRRLQAAVVLAALVAALFAVPNALATAFTVNSTADPGNGVCDVFECTLREAINAASGGDTITFSIGLGGSATIQTHSPLPSITHSVTIDGTTQTGYAGSPLIQVDGQFAGSVDGFNVSSDGVTIRGLAIAHFDSGIVLNSPGSDTVAGNYLGVGLSGGTAAPNKTGVSVASPNNTIGGPSAADRNVISGNSVQGVRIAGQLNSVFGNYIGTDAAGSFAVPNNVGVVVNDFLNTIGDGASGDRNVISGNTTVGVLIGNASDNVVDDNYIGTDADGASAIPNGGAGWQILGGPISANGNSGSFNVISGNGGPGLLIDSTVPDGAQISDIEDNFIGTDASGEQALGNSGPGVLIEQNSGVGNSAIRNNTIAYNSKGIVAGDNTSRNEFLQNRIHDNTGLGIDLNQDGVTANDTDDADSGANGLLNFPELTSAVRQQDGSINVSGSYDGAPGTNDTRLDFYASPTCDPTGFGEGATWIGFLSAEQTPNGDFSFSDSALFNYVAPGSSYITATATDTSGSTSEFSACHAVSAPSGLTLTVNSPTDGDDGVCDASNCTLREAINAANLVSGTDTIAFALPGPSLQITVGNSLPAINDDVIIDGSTQPGIQVDGTNAVTGSIGFDVENGLDGSTIQDLTITGFPGGGIELNGPGSVIRGDSIVGNGSQGVLIFTGGNKIGGAGSGDANVISGTAGVGIQDSAVGSNTIIGNRIGTDAAGTAANANLQGGIRINGSAGTQTITGNLVSGNSLDGILVDTANDVDIKRNTIGLDLAGDAALGNELAGVRIVNTASAQVGGTASAAGNVISANQSVGVQMEGAAGGTLVQGNLIGTTGNGLSAMPNGNSDQVVVLDSSGVLVGGTSVGARNVVAANGNGPVGVLISGGESNTIQGNYIGTDTNGTSALGNGEGIVVDSGSDNNTIGGTVPGAGNLISGSNGAGIFLNAAGGPVTGNRIFGNDVGTDNTGTGLLPNDVGIQLNGASQTTVGSASPGAGNVIAGSADVGILLILGSDSNTFAGNFIGTDRNDSQDLGNADGMRLVNGGGSNNLIGPSNVFAHNADQGIELDEGTGNRISASTFHDNGNDAIFLATGANNNQSQPTLKTAWRGAFSTSISGTLTSAPSTSYFIELFSTPTCSGKPQGQTYLGFTTATTDGSGKAVFGLSSSFPALGDEITATATRFGTNDTSQFSACATVTSTGVYTVNTTADHDDGSCDASDCTLREAINAADLTSGGNTIAFAIPGSAPFTIAPLTPLPPITGPTTIDGTTQGGAPPGSKAITLSGATVGNGNGLVLGVGSDLSTIRGLAIRDFAVNGSAGIRILSSNDFIAGNYIGTDETGTSAHGNYNGIVVESANFTDIGLTSDADRNVISGNHNVGVLIDGTAGGAAGNTVRHNYIGWNASGNGALGNLGQGVQVLNAINTTIGSATAADGNLIGNNFNDVFLGAFNSSTTGHDNTVQHNLIGLSADDSTSFQNSGNGIEVMDAGTDTIADNWIAHTYQGIDVCGPSNNTVTGNTIGTNQAFTQDFGVFNQGVSVFGGACLSGGGNNGPATGNQIVGNVVVNSSLNGIAADSDDNVVSPNTVENTKNGAAIEVNGNGNTIGPTNFLQDNHQDGIKVDGGTANKITQNAIQLSGKLGINLRDPSDPPSGVTPNDNGDADTGANDLQNWPVITSAQASGSTTPIEATLDTVVPGTYHIEAFNSAACDPTGNGEGGEFVGSGDISFTNPNQSFTLTLGTALAPGSTVTLTATAPDGSTSEFSNCVTVTATGTLQGSVAVSSDPPASQAIDLTTLGSLDWAIWGYAGGGTSTSLAPDVRKASGSAISNLTNIDPAPSVALRGIGQFAEPFTFSWSNGSGPATATNAQGGLQHDGQQQALSTLNHGFAFDLPADTTLRTARIYVVTNRADGRLTASLSDGSATDYVSTLPHATDVRTGVYSITYAALSAGQTLHVQWVESLDNCPSFHCDNAAIFAVALTTPDTLVVTDPGDAGGSTCGADCTLRQAINAANANPDSTIAFDLPSSSTTISPESDLPAVTATTTIDATTQPGYSGSPLVTLDGTNVSNGDGFQLLGGNATVRGFDLIDWSDAGVFIAQNNSNTVAGNYIGIDTGGIAAPNGEGVIIRETSDGNTIGGPTAVDRNVISGNGQYGIDIGGGFSQLSENNKIEGNYIGLRPDGTGSPGGNSSNNFGGIVVAGGSNTIGGTIPGARNYISGNDGPGIRLQGPSNVVKGNTIGLDASGNGAGNTENGIEVSPIIDTQAPNMIGDTAGGGNVISGNFEDGIFLSQIAANPGTVIQGNLIGTDPTGATAVGNGQSGIEANDASYSVISGNVVSGNLGTLNAAGIYAFGFDSHDNAIVGNKVGTNAAGTAPLGNHGDGIWLDESSGTVSGNVVSGNFAAGVRIAGPEPPGTRSFVTGNLIGTNAGGTTALGNGTGVVVGGSSDDAIGGTNSGDGNVISGNIGAGVDINNAGGTTLLGNTVGLNAAGTGAVANATGVLVENGAAGSTIGTTSPGAGNVISGNAVTGVLVDGNPTTGNVVEGNFIGTGAGGVGSFANGGNGVQIANGANANTVRRNTIEHNGNAGVRIPQASLHNTVTANSIDLNTGLGIDVGGGGITANDSPDADGLQNFPTITGVSTNTVNGSLSSTAGTTFNIDLFDSPVCDALGNGEGRTFLGTTTVTTPPLGTGTFTANVPGLPAGHVVTATAIAPNGDTSEFSPCIATVQPPIATNLSLVPTPTSTAAGAPRVKLSDVPPSALIQAQSNQQTAPVNQTPVNQTPINQLAATNAPVNQTPINQTPVNQTPVNQTGFSELTQSIFQLGSIPLSTIPLVRTGGWDAELATTPLAGLPLQNVTLRDVYALNATNQLPPHLRDNATNPITIGDLDLSRSTLGRLPAMAFALGKLTLTQLHTDSGADYTTWCTAANVAGVDCTSSTSTVLSAGLQGAPVNQTPVNQTPVNQTLIQALAAVGAPVNQTPVNQTPINQTRIGALPVNQTPVNQTPVNQTPVNQLSLQVILAANAPVNQTPVNQTPVNQLSNPSLIVNCTLVSCTSSSTTLGSAFAAHAILEGVTLGDLRRDAPESLLASWTIADLRGYGNLTIGGLLASLPQPNNFTLADVLVLVLGSPNGVQGLSFEGINLFDTNLAQVSTGGSTVAYRAQFGVQPNGGPNGVPSTVSVTSTLGNGFLYVPGSSALTSTAGTCGTATPIANPVSTTLNNGALQLTWSINATVGNGYALCFTARPGITLGPQAASLDAQPSAGPTASATGGSVDVGDTFEPNGVASTAPEIFNDSFYLSYLTSSTDVDFYRFAAPPSGTVMTFHLSHLPADYDLVVYGPPETQLRPSVTSAVPLDEPPVTDNGVDPTHATDPLPSQTLDDLQLQSGLPMVGVSASRGTDPEDVVVTSQGGSGFYTVQVTGYNGATSAKPYMLRVATSPPRQTSTVAAQTITGTVGPALPALPTGLNTVFLVNRQQLEGVYGSTAATNVMNALSGDSATFTSLGFPNVTLSVDRFTAVQTAYAAWNANPGSPAAANAVVQAINATVDSQIRAQPNGAGLKYLVIVGGDRIIPFARLDDFTVTASNEAGYASTFGLNTDMFATLNAGQMLSDDPYGDLNPVPYLTRQLYIPELSVGRLVETPDDIIRTLNNFVSGSVNGHLDPTSSLTTGYDFLFDGAQAVNTALSARVGSAQTLLDDPSIPANPNDPGDSWTLSDLIGAFLPLTGPAPSITSLNGHASHYQFEPPNNDVTGARSALFDTSALTGSPTSLANRLVFSMGCHAGLSVADATVTAGASTLDWPQAYAQKSVGAYLGNTGYGYGDSLVVAYSEELNRLFAQNIAAGSTVGNALATAKQAYYGELGVFGVYDEKAMAEFTLYGLPMWSVSGPGNVIPPPQTQQASDTLQPAASPAPAAPTQQLTSGPDPATGLDSETFTSDFNFTGHRVNTADGSYWTGANGVQVTQLRPIQPKAFVPLTGTLGHGALITELTSSDTNCINPVYARPIVDLTGNEGELSFADVAFPSKLQTLRTFVTSSGLQQRLVLVTGQFFTQHCGTDPDPQVGVQRLFSHISGRVLRSPSADYISPAFQRIDAAAVGTNAGFAVDVTDQAPGGVAGQVKEVVVGVRSGTASVWTFANLTQSSTNPTRWTGGVPITGTQFEYFVQAVDAAGDVGVSTNKGFYFDGEPTPSQPPPGSDTSASLTGTQAASGWYTSGATLNIVKPAGVTVQASIDGGPFGTPPTTITGDGFHTIDLRGSNGFTQTLFAPIDTAGPEIVIGTPADLGQYVQNSTVKADYFCRDAGSGLSPTSACAGTVPNGANIDTGALGTHTFKVNGVSDNAGHSTPDKIVTYTVVTTRNILFSSQRTGDGDIYTMKPDGTGVTALSPAAKLDEQPSWSPDGSKIAFASKRADKDGSGLDIWVMDPNGQNAKRLTTAKDDDTAPSWSPSGNQIVFQSKRDAGKPPEIYVMNADGTNQTRLTNSNHMDIEPTWSPDGSKIAFMSDRLGGPNIWVMDPTGANPKQLTFTKAPEGDPAWSPDGTLIAYGSKKFDKDGSTFDVLTMKPDGTFVQRLTTAKGDDFEPAWSRDGTKIAFNSSRDGNPEVYVMNANGTGQTRLTNKAGFDRQPDW